MAAKGSSQIRDSSPRMHAQKANLCLSLTVRTKQGVCEARRPKNPYAGLRASQKTSPATSTSAGAGAARRSAPQSGAEEREREREGDREREREREREGEGGQ